MEGSNEAMQQEEDPSSHEKAKRKLKTPAQIEALEIFFNEHKYPTEAMKLEFAKEIGLSEKQVSGWFCHRRLKEKKVLQGEICTNGKQNLSSSVIHDRTSAVKQESCSSTKQVDRNIDSKEVESKLYYGYKPSFDVPAYEAQNKYAEAAHNHTTEDRSSGSNSSSQGSYLQNNENMCIAQTSRYKTWNDTSMFMCNKDTGGKSKEYMVNSRSSFLQDENDTSAISALKWKLGRHYREDGPPLGVEFDPLPPGSFDSPVRDSKCEPYYVGDSMQQRSPSFCRSINESRIYDKCNIEKLPSNAYEDQRSFRRTNPGFSDSNETLNLYSSHKTFSSHHNHVQYPAISTDEAEKSTNRTSCFYGTNNPKFFRKSGTYNSNAGYILHQNSVTFPNYDTRDFEGEYDDSKLFVVAQKKYDSIDSEYWHQPQNLLEDKIRKENTKRKHSAFQPEIFANNKTKTADRVSNVEFRQQQLVGRGFETPARQEPFMRQFFDMESNLQQDQSSDTFSSLD